MPYYGTTVSETRGSHMDGEEGVRLHCLLPCFPLFFILTHRCFPFLCFCHLLSPLLVPHGCFQSMPTRWMTARTRMSICTTTRRRDRKTKECGWNTLRGKQSDEAHSESAADLLHPSLCILVLHPRLAFCMLHCMSSSALLARFASF